jgi:glyoxylase-like metal-dependent hydrolase (beta-lactamase superfamily II)
VGPILKVIWRLGGALLFLVIAAGVGFWFVFFAKLSAVTDSSPVAGVRVVKDGFVSVGVVDAGDRKVVLIDAGHDAAGESVLRELSRRGLGASAVTAIFLTHGHPDHTAGCLLFPNAQVYALQADVALVEGREGSHGPITRFMSHKPNGIHVTHVLHDGDVVTVGSRTIRVLAVPGHTPGSAAYLLANYLFVGDSANVTSWGEVIGAPWPLTDDVEQNHTSLKALANTLHPEAGSIVAVVPSHSGIGTFSALTAFMP